MRKLRSNFVPGSSHWAVRRAQWTALGLSDEDMTKPKIAVVNTSSELAICFSHLDGVAARVKIAIRAAGGVPFEVRTAAPSDFITSAGRRGGYILPSRDLIANDIEVQVEGAQLDGMVLLASCDKTVPGQIMAAARLNIPSIVVICGYQPSGEWRGHPMDIEEVFLNAGHHLAGKLSLEELAGMSANAVRGPGVCSGMGTANSMHVATEALGMCLPGTAPVLANSPAMFAAAEAAGARILAMVEEDLKPRDILTPAALENAVRAVLAVSGSINCVKHLQAIAIEAGASVDVYDLFARLGETTPVLSAVRPNGETPVEAFEAAGGARAVLTALAPLLRREAMTVTGRTTGEEANVPSPDTSVVRPLANPVSRSAAIVLVRGSLAPEGGIVKFGLAEADRVRRFEGPAIVFEAADAAMNAVRDGRVKAGQVLVLRGLGPRGAPGMATASRVIFAIDGMGLGRDVAVVTDGQLSGLVNKGLVVGEASPEAAAGGPLALVRDGDPVLIDVTARTVELRVDAAELERRAAALPPPMQEPVRGWLSIYRRTVRPLRDGAVMTE